MSPRLALDNISKSYPGVVANDGVSLSIMPGEIHAILGENGAGKSTLMKIIYGAVQADSGKIFYDGRPVESHNPAIARSLGIEMVYQHFALFDSVSVVENMALSLNSAFNLKATAASITKLSQHYGMPLDPWARVHDLSVGERQRVEIVRCLMQAPKLLILDEPTSVLTPQAVDKLFETLRMLAGEGCSILYISHKLDEVQELCDTATVLRNGKVTGTTKPKQTTAPALARLMVGSELPEVRVQPGPRSTEPFLKVERLSLPAERSGTALHDISFDVHGGEIVGLAGVSGNGQATLIASLSGERLSQAPGSVQINGKPVGKLGPEARRRRGLTFVPEERLGRGAVPPHSLWENALLTGHRSGLVRKGLIDHGKASAFAASIIDRYKVKANGPKASAQSLSGGNLQKYIVGREIELRPRVFLVSQPTWGVDVGAAAFIRQSIIDLSRSGAAVLVISEELDELFEISDRLLVMCQGRISAPLVTGQTNREEVGLLMTGITGGDMPGREKVALSN